MVPVSQILQLQGLHESKRNRVDAVSQTGGPRPVVEDVAEVSITAAARDFALDVSQASRRMCHDVFFCDGLPETRPAGAGIELRGGAEERCVAADAAEHSLVVQIPVRA